MSSLWIGLGTLAVGLGTSLYSTNAQKKANQAATNANVAAQDSQNNSAWASWLMSKGMLPTSPVTAGTVPSAGGYTAINTKLPIWANVNYGSSVPGSNGAMRLVKKGTPTTTGIMGLASTPAATATTGAATDATGGGPTSLSSKDKILRNAMDPLNLMGSEPRTIGNTVKRTLDPFGLFG